MKYIIVEIIDFIRNNEISCFCDFVDYCCDNRQDWLGVLLEEGGLDFVYSYFVSLSENYDFDDDCEV